MPSHLEYADLANKLTKAEAEIERLRAEVALWKDRYEAADRDMKAMVADYEDYLNGLKHK